MLPLSSPTEWTTIPAPKDLLFKQKVTYWANQFNIFCWLDSCNDNLYQYSSFEWCLAADALNILQPKNGQSFFDDLTQHQTQNKAYLFGYLGYDLKNEIEQLTSNNEDLAKMPEAFLFQPRIIIQQIEDKVRVNRNYPETFEIIEQIQNTSLPKQASTSIEKFERTVDRTTYLNTVKQIKSDIIEGDYYEMNYCQAFYAPYQSFNSLQAYHTITEHAAAPFSGYLKLPNHQVVCASPERFLKLADNQLISQPIKGTAAKSDDWEENLAIQTALANDEKERAENVMIVDLVRNDLTKSSVNGTITVEELCKVYGFKNINQLISTVKSIKQEDVSSVEALKNAFPMGSMTGAPKVMTMQCIEQYEHTKRGLYSGAIGYFTPSGDFDFNVVIRTLIQVLAQQKLVVHVGGAITYDSVPEQEYLECIIKLKSLVAPLMVKNDQILD